MAGLREPDHCTAAADLAASGCAARRRNSRPPRLCNPPNPMLVCQAEERAENRDPTQSEGTYPVTSLVDWRHARRGGMRGRGGGAGETGRKAGCAWRE